MYLKIVSETSETKHSLDFYDVGYLLSLYEGLTLKSYIEGLYMRDSTLKQKEAEQQRKMANLMKGVGG